MNNSVDDNKKLVEETITKHKDLMKTQKYQQEIKFFSKLINDFIDAVRTCWIYSSRDYNLFENSMLLNHTDEFLESAVSCEILVNNGALHAARRELRYLLETSVKYLVVDQNSPQLCYKDKIKYFHENIPRSSISCIENIWITGLNKIDTKEFINSANDVYKKLSKYVHPSKQQIEEIIERQNRSAFLGFETEIDIKRISGLAYKVLEFVIAIYLTCLGFSSTGDIFINYLDAKDDWKFHKSKYIKKISESYNYKLERKQKSN